MANLSGLLTAALWLLCAGLAAVGVWRHDALVAVQWERLTGPLGFAMLHVPLAVGWDLLRRVAARLAPRAASFLAPVLPMALLVGFWVPVALEPVSPPAEAARKTIDAPDIVVVTLDTVRADHVGAVSGARSTPEIDRLAARGVSFTQAVTSSPVTAPAHASMFTGLDVPRHHLFANGATLPADSPTFVEALRARGYRTGAFVSAHVLDRETGLQVGFQHYDDRWGFGQRLGWLPITGALGGRALPPRRSGAETVDQALRWLYSDDAPGFLWVHLFDAHGPYAPPSQFAPAAQVMAEARRVDREDMKARGELRDIGNRSRTQLHQQSVLYEASIRWVDALVGRLVGRLRGDPIVVVVGDHGESLGEHDVYFGHGGDLWEEAVHVPFVVRWPGRYDRGVKEPGLVSVRGVARLVLQAAGLEGVSDIAPEPSVLLYTTGQEAARAESKSVKANFTARQSAAIRYNGGKLLARGAEPVVWYDLVADPKEANPLPVPPPLETDAATLRGIVDAPPPRLSDRQRTRLEALGYLE